MLLSINNNKYCYYYYWLCHVACGILVPQPGIKPPSPAVEAGSPNHWITREVPIIIIIIIQTARL